MTVIHKLSLTHFRNMSQTDLAFSPTYNCIIGANGAGKTSVLEAIHLLSYGKSFRNLDDKLCLIQQEAEEFTVFTEISAENTIHRLGMHRGRATRTKLKLDGEVCRSLSKFTLLLPTILIEPNSHALLSEGPSQRRHYLDWGLFHVEQNYGATLEAFHHCLKQRNAALRAGLSSAECQIWDKQLSELAENIDAYRAQFIKLIEPYFNEMLQRLEFSEMVELSYSRGWESAYHYSEALQRQFSKDKALGYTSSGPQRADINFCIGAMPAADKLSRGQEKLVIAALLFAQAAYYQELKQRNCCFLIDDLASELDPINRSRFFNLISQFPAQYFITAIEASVFANASQLCEKKLFHVEHGEITSL